MCSNKCANMRQTVSSMHCTVALSLPSFLITLYVQHYDETNCHFNALHNCTYKIALMMVYWKISPTYLQPIQQTNISFRLQLLVKKPIFPISSTTIHNSHKIKFNRLKPLVWFGSYFDGCNGWASIIRVLYSSTGGWLIRTYLHLLLGYCTTWWNIIPSTMIQLLFWYDNCMTQATQTHTLQW